MSDAYGEFKAYSQNMEHFSTQTTEKYYSSHSTDDIKRIVTESEIEVIDKDKLKEFEEFLAFKKMDGTK